jgi:hypothetical protein
MWTCFTGRVGELAELDHLLTTTAKLTAAAVGGGSTSVVISAVSGTAGVGKTALALRWAHRVRAGFPDGQLYVNLRGYDPDQPLSAGYALAGFLRALGVPGQEIPPEPDERAPCIGVCWMGGGSWLCWTTRPPWSRSARYCLAPPQPWWW